MTWLSVVNWDKYQDIRVDDPWYVKTHICILDDKKIQGLDVHPRLLWYQLLPLAGRYQNAIPCNVSAIAKETRLERHTVAKSLQTLINARRNPEGTSVLQSDSLMVAIEEVVVHANSSRRKFWNASKSSPLGSVSDKDVMTSAISSAERARVTWWPAILYVMAKPPPFR